MLESEIEKNILFIGAYNIEKYNEKKPNEKIKNELLKSLIVNDKIEETEINIANVIDPGEAIGLINNYEEMIKTHHEKVIAFIAKQREILGQFKNAENFFENIEQSTSTTYYKITLYKFLTKHPKLKLNVTIELF